MPWATRRIARPARSGIAPAWLIRAPDGRASNTRSTSRCSAGSALQPQAFASVRAMSRRAAFCTSRPEPPRSFRKAKKMPGVPRIPPGSAAMSYSSSTPWAQDASTESARPNSLMQRASAALEGWRGAPLRASRTKRSATGNSSDAAAATSDVKGTHTSADGSGSPSRNSKPKKAAAAAGSSATRASSRSHPSPSIRDEGKSGRNPRRTSANDASPPPTSSSQGVVGSGSAAASWSRAIAD